jgi:hypothetical protein
VPSRASLRTSRYAHEIFSWDNTTPSMSAAVRCCTT